MTHYFTRLVLLFNILFIINKEGVGQSLSCENNNAAFSISQVIGCDSIITVTNQLSNAVNVEFYFDFNGTLNNENRVTANADGSATFTYKKTGKFKILQIGSLNGQGFIYCRDIEIINTQAPIAWITSCASGELNIVFANFQTNTQYDRLGINWGDNSSTEYINKGELLTRSHIYQRNGDYRVAVFGVYNQANCDKGRALDLGIFNVGNNTDFERLLIHRVEVNENDEIRSSFTNSNGATATLQVKTGTSAYQNTQASATNDGNLTLTIPNIAASNDQNIRLLIEDQCQNQLIKNEITVVNLSVASQGTENLISWSRNLVPGEFTKYELYKNDQLLATFTSITETSYTDNTVTCGETNSYKVIAYQNNAIIGDVTSHSKQVSISGTNTQPEPPLFASVSVENNAIALNSTLLEPIPDNYKIIVERSEGGSFQEIASVDNQMSYQDTQANPNTDSYCYRLIFENACGSQSDPSETICSIYLSLEEMQINWTTDSPFTENAPQWSLEKSLSGQIQKENIQNTNSYSVSQDILSEDRPSYRIISTSSNGTKSYSNQIQYQKGIELFFPTAFSPNNDQHNDIFIPIGNIYDQFRMIIYNRWGSPLFSTEDPDLGWDGTIEGKEAPPGNYTYKVEIIKGAQTIYSKSGAFLLIR